MMHRRGIAVVRDYEPLLLLENGVVLSCIVARAGRPWMMPDSYHRA